MLKISSVALGLPFCNTRPLMQFSRWAGGGQGGTKKNKREQFHEELFGGKPPLTYDGRATATVDHAEEMERKGGPNINTYKRTDAFTVMKEVIIESKATLFGLVLLAVIMLMVRSQIDSTNKIILDAKDRRLRKDRNGKIIGNKQPGEEDVEPPHKMDK